MQLHITIVKKSREKSVPNHSAGENFQSPQYVY